jgi:hypothetical protein
MVVLTLSNAVWWIESQCQGLFFTFFSWWFLFLHTLPLDRREGLAFHYALPTCHGSIVPFRGNVLIPWQCWANLSQRIACTFFCWGLIPPLVSIKPRYSILWVQKNDLATLTFNPASRNLLRTSLSLSKWSSRVPLVMTSRLSMYALIL